MPNILRVRYAGDPPREVEFLDSLGLDLRPERFALLAASQTLDRDWARAFAAAPDRVPAAQRTTDGPVFLFASVLQHLIPTGLLSRTEERVTLQRAAREVAGDEEMARVLRKDILAWASALALVDAHGFDLSRELPQPFRDALAHPQVNEVLRRLQARVRELRAATGRESFEAAARAFLQSRYRPPPVVVLDGFTQFAPLVEQFLAVCQTAGTTLVFVHPYRAAQAHGFAVMDRPYSRFQGRERVEDRPTPCAAPGELRHLQQHLFADAPAPPPAADGSVTIEEYGHLHQEAATCIRRIQGYLQAGVRPSDIAVVVRNAYEFQPVLQEEADRQRLVDSDGRRVPLTARPRLLLLTPLGRFVLALYQVWEGGALNLAPDQFETVIASGWLGGHLQQTTDQFAAVRGQVFARCRTRAEWDAGLRTLDAVRRALPDDSRLPAAAVREGTVPLWRWAVDQVERLCRRLFAVPSQSIGRHIRILLDELSRLTPDVMRQAEREVLGRLREALEQAAGSASLPLNTAEFGDILASLAREQDWDADEEAGKVWCTIPPAVDGYGKRVVFYLGVDDRRVPQPYADPWPFVMPALDEHQATERYLFLAVIRSAREALHLSCARAEEGVPLRPSVYLEEAAAALGRPITVPGAAIDAQPVAAAAPAPPPTVARRDRYTLGELAHFGLCPYRYKLEGIALTGRVYRTAADAFQLVPLAQGVWIDRLLTTLEGRRTVCRGETAVREVIDAALGETAASVQAMFPALRDVHWRTAERYARASLNYEVVRHARDDRYPVGFHAADSSSVYVADGDRVVTVVAPVGHEVRVGKFRWPVLAPLFQQEWLHPGREPRGQVAELTPLAGVPVFATLYHAALWWKRATRTAYFAGLTAGQDTEFARKQAADAEEVRIRVRLWLPVIESGRYPKNPGDHCAQCPVRGECLGK
jgi:hypothetical protein